LLILDESKASNKIFQSFSQFSSKQNILSKDLLITRPNDLKYQLDKLDSIYAAIILKFINANDSYGIRKVSLQFESSAGNLPNFDLYSCIGKLLEMHHFEINFQSINFFFSIFLKSLLRRVYRDSHRNFLLRYIYDNIRRNQVNSVTLVVDNSRREWKSNCLDNYKELYFSLESIVQSINNLEEKFHQSLFFYHFIDVSNYLSIPIYFCGIVLIVLIISSFIHVSEYYKVSKDKTLTFMLYQQTLSFFGIGSNYYSYQSFGDIFDKLQSLPLFISLGFEDVSFCYIYGLTKVLFLFLGRFQNIKIFTISS
jgi:hypothetical protein